MPLHPKLDEKLSKISEPSVSIDMLVGNDITFVANGHGKPMTLFFGKRRSDGWIAGERCPRTTKRLPGGLDVKSSHWDNCGRIWR